MIVRWLSLSLFLMFGMPLAFLLFLFFFRPDAADYGRHLELFQLTEAQQKICNSTDDEKLIKAAISQCIGFAIADRKAGHTLKETIFPYFTYEDYRASNPDCCRVHHERPGDFPSELTPFFDGKLQPRIYAVDFAYKFGEGRSTGTTHRTSLIACYGEAVSEDHLLHLLRLSGRPTM